MLQLLSPIPREFEQLVLCYYINETARVQMLRIANIEQWLFERAIAPQEGLFFKAPSQAQLEVQWYDAIGVKFLEVVAAKELRINEVNYAELKESPLLDSTDLGLLPFENLIASPF